ncbi:MAG TPA: M56 family metallopeptidase [Streptosporangiaceae bacterium]|nr:M56 family metallopeptidase [Streptosporangiaceae bacterium]
MNLSAVLGVVAAVSAVAFVIMVGLAGGWRGEPGAASTGTGGPRPRTPQQAAFTLRWRATWVTEVIRISLLAVVGLTPAGAALMHLLAPSGNWLQVAAAWMIMLAALAAAGLAGQPWRRRAKSLIPGLYPRGAGGRWRGRTVIITCLQYALVLMITAYAMRAGPVVFAGLVIVVVPIAALASLRQPLLRRLPPSEHLTAVMQTLTFPPRRRSPVAVVGWRARDSLANALAVDGMMRHPLIVVAPPLVELLDGRQLRGVLAHELAHVLHGDTWRRLARVILVSEASLATAIALGGFDPAQDVLGLPDHVDAQTAPFLLAVWYLTSRALMYLNLRAARAEERAADARTVLLTGDPAGCADGICQLAAMLGAPERWTFGQRLLLATHPPPAARLQRLADRALAGFPAGHAG